MQNNNKKKHCLYCGKGSLKLCQNDSFTETAYICGSCGLIFTEADYNLDLFALNGSGEEEKTPRGSEEKILRAALELMWKNSWNHAAGTLQPRNTPLRHAWEFAVYRNLCQSASLLKSQAAAKRYQQLSILEHNLSCREYFLTNPDSETAYQILQGLFQALMLWGSLDIACLTDYSNVNSSNFIDSTNRRRAEILCSFADILKERGSDNVHGTDYLKMAVQLRSQALVLALEKYNSHFSACYEEYLQLPPAMRRKIKAEIELLNGLIKQRDPDFVPPKVPPDPKLLPVPPILFTGPGFCILVILPMMIFDLKKLSPFTATLYAVYFIICLSTPYLYYWYYDNCRRSRDFCRHCQ